VMVKDFLTGVGGSNPLELRAVAGKLYFAADDGVHGFEPWVSDGTESGTLLLADIEPGAESSNPAGFSYSNGKMFFSAWDQVHGRELWGLDIQLIPRGFLPYIIAVGNDSDQQQ
jgi:ELWxxDGT repeat protein